GKSTGQSTAKLAELPKYILRVESDRGLIGLGETYRDVNVENLRRNARALVGTNALDLRWSALPFPEDREYDGFELAIYDLAGKALELPVYQLLGGRCRDRVECSMWTGRRTPADAGRKAFEGMQRGFDTIKFKCNQHDDVTSWAREVQDRCGPGMKMIFDPNQRWDPYQFAVEQMQKLKRGGFNVLGIEDPLNRQSLSDYRKLREIGLNVVLHVALPYCAYGQRAEDAVRGLKEEALDAFNFNGSMASFVRLADLAHLAEKPCWHGSEVDLGLLEAGYIHASAAAPACTWPSDIFGRLVREHDLLKTPLQFDGKNIVVPTAPGLGVELDDAAVEKYRTGDDIDLVL
ncbi:MAG TPA: mandelate racemase/muconate lactonizing enzyme family protein, partial [Tepidisphaeraceae bacterium]|nr:mandelate racemase/muconate lactonizing enzyme family protein [Tepidisphaeraceae bacterium]